MLHFNFPCVVESSECTCTVVSQVSAHGRLKLTAKQRGGRLHKQAICMYNAYVREPYDHQKEGVGAYTKMGAYSREYGNNSKQYHFGSQSHYRLLSSQWTIYHYIILGGKSEH